MPLASKKDPLFRFVFGKSLVIKKQLSPLSVWYFEKLLAHKEVGHFISTRRGGHSAPPYDSLNLSFNVGDDSQKVLRNRRLLASTLGFTLARLTTCKQVHGSEVKIVTSSGDEDDLHKSIHGADAMITQVPELCLMILVADCVPLILYDPARRAVGLVHAGWKGTLGAIGEKTVRALERAFGSTPSEMVAGIGPSIGPCCYEVGPDVALQFKEIFGDEADGILRASSQGRSHFDLWAANLRQLVHAGIPEKNIEVARTCTCHHGGDFFSHRREVGKTGRFGVGVLIRG
jgi:hypothetical protein